MSQIKSFRDLIAWQKAFRLTAGVYAASAEFPRHEIYGLTQQLRRAAVSVASNIAEGAGRHSRRDYVHFLDMAKGSLFEVQTQLLLASEFGYLPSSELFDASEEVERILNGLIRSLRQ